MWTRSAALSRAADEPGGHAWTRASVALLVGLVFLTIGLVVTLAGSPLVVVYANNPAQGVSIGEIDSGAGVCQDAERLPVGITAIRVRAVAIVGPRVTVTVTATGGAVTAGTVDSGWTSGAVTVPVKSVARPLFPVRVCLELGRSAEKIGLIGWHTRAAVAARSAGGRPLPGRFTVEYMRPGSSSWLSLVRTVARHMGLGRAPAGTWVALLELAMMGAALAIASWLVVKELR